jgi:hypothetical protein
VAEMILEDAYIRIPVVFDEYIKGKDNANS